MWEVMSMSQYEQFIGVILLTAVVIVLLGALLSALVFVLLGLREMWRKENEND